MNTTMKSQVVETDAPDAGAREVEIAIIGSGFSGIGMAARLREAGIGDFVVLERANDVGGTWRDNIYPGAACDVPSNLYSFSFARNPQWSRSYSPQPEILAYLQACVERFGVVPHLRLNHEVTNARWDDHRRRWAVETTGGAYAARILVSGAGPLSDPSIPDLPGISEFRGATFHSARWNYDHDITGERVAVIGTGASSIQFVPQIQPHVGRLHLFQRTPPWVVPRTDRPFSRFERLLWRVAPNSQRLLRAGIYWGREGAVVGLRNPKLLKALEPLARANLRRQVSDPELRAKLTPNYTIGCKRVLISNDYYPALTKPNAEVVTSGISHVCDRSIVTADGAEREIDTIIFGTGFHVTDPAVADRVRGRDGVLLRDVWRDGMSAYRGTTVAGFPNFFMLIGPNTGLGHTSMVVMAEAQIGYVLDAVRTMQSRGIETLEPRADEQIAYNQRLQQSLEGTVWNAGGCVSWYLDDHGRNTTVWPHSTIAFRRMLREFDIEAYSVESPA